MKQQAMCSDCISEKSTPFHPTNMQRLKVTTGIVKSFPPVKVKKTLYEAAGNVQ
jgi:hypothetical protein